MKRLSKSACAGRTAHQQRNRKELVHRRPLPRVLLRLEELEDRTLPAAITLPGVPTWDSEGPAPILDGIVAGTNNYSYTVTGAVEAIAAHPGDANVLYVGTVNGGVWKTENATNASPS